MIASAKGVSKWSVDRRRQLAAARPGREPEPLAERRMVTKQLIGSLLMAIALSGCGSEALRPRDGDTVSASYEGVWKLQSGSGPQGQVLLVEGWDISLEIADGRAEGRAACNSYYGRVSISGSSFKARKFSLNQMGCLPAVERSEHAYMTALVGADTIAREGKDADTERARRGAHL